MKKFCNEENLTWICLISLCFISSVICSPIVSEYRKPFSLDPIMTTCSANMACQWRVCLWTRGRATNCQLFDNHCTCPEGSECVPPLYSDPMGNLISYEYRCL